MSVDRFVPEDIRRLYEVHEWRKLLPRLEGGGGGGCPVIVFGIRRAAFVDDRGSPIDPVQVDPALITSEENDAV